MITRRIALFLPSLGGGGAERVMVLLANGLAARGLKIDLVAANAVGSYRADLSTAVRVVDLQAPRVLLSFPSLVRYLRREQPYALISALDYANVVALWAKKISRVNTRVVVSEHSTLSAAYASVTSFRARFIPWLMRRSYKAASAIVAVSSGVADDLASGLGISRERIRVVYNPVVTSELMVMQREESSHRWLSGDSPPVIVAAGRFVPAKDFKTLISAFAELRRGRDVRLIILGEGELRSELEALVNQLNLESCVELPGFTRNPYAWIRKCSLFVLSSVWEGLPTVVIEAMACGVPVVSTDCPSGPREILEHGKWGRLVPVGSVGELAEAMAAALDESIRPDVRRRAADFDVDKAVDGYLAVMGLG